MSSRRSLPHQPGFGCLGFGCWWGAETKHPTPTTGERVPGAERLPLRTPPIVALAAALTLAVGVGGASGIFALVDAVLICAGLGEHGRAFKWLETANQEHDPQLLWLKVDPRLDPLQADARFADLTRRVGLR